MSPHVRRVATVLGTAAALFLFADALYFLGLLFGWTPQNAGCAAGFLTGSAAFAIVAWAFIDRIEP